MQKTLARTLAVFTLTFGTLCCSSDREDGGITYTAIQALPLPDSNSALLVSHNENVTLILLYDFNQRELGWNKSAMYGGPVDGIWFSTQPSGRTVAQESLSVWPRRSRDKDAPGPMETLGYELAVMIDDRALKFTEAAWPIDWYPAEFTRSGVYEITGDITVITSRQSGGKDLFSITPRKVYTFVPGTIASLSSDGSITVLPYAFHGNLDEIKGDSELSQVIRAELAGLLDS